jgi:hypothetical protein
MDPVSLLSVPSRPSFTEQDRQCLCFYFQAPGLRQTVSLAAELRTMAADLARAHPSPPRLPGRRDWIVALTTPPVPLTLASVRLWEGEMLAVEHRWPGCHFLGWMTSWAPGASIGLTERAPGCDAAARQRRSQRELVMASLLRCPPSERRGIVHGRGVPR